MGWGHERAKGPRDANLRHNKRGTYQKVKMHEILAEHGSCGNPCDCNCGAEIGG